MEPYRTVTPHQTTAFALPSGAWLISRNMPIQPPAMPDTGQRVSIGLDKKRHVRTIEPMNEPVIEPERESTKPATERASKIS